MHLQPFGKILLLTGADDRVLPKLRGLFGEWEDRWWPQPMPRPERAEVSAFQSPLAAE
jgi:hypothetical protein